MDTCQSNQYIQSRLKVPQSHQDWKKYQALKRAIRHGQEDETQRLLAEKVPLDVHLHYSKGYLLVTPLHLAVYRGNLNLVKILLDQGASVNSKDANEETPLMLSVRLRKYSITDLLLTADSIENLWEHDSGFNHLHIACLRNNVSVVKKLIALGADVNETVRESPFNWVGYTPLHFAVECHNVEIVKLLVDSGADLMKKNAQSMTPLRLAHELRNEKIIDILLAAQMFELGNPADHHGLTHFHIACTRNNVNFVHHFLKQKVNVELEVSLGCPKWSYYRPLTFAIYYECSDVVEFLLGEGVWNYNLDEDDSLQLAYEIGNQEVINLLLSNKAIKSRDTSNSRLLSKLQGACMTKNFKKITKLLSRAERKSVRELNLSIWNGVTLAHFLANDLPTEAIEIFQNTGATFSMKDARGLTPLHVLFNRIKHLNILIKSIPSNLFDTEMNPSDNYGLTHFHMACATNNVTLMETFIMNKVNVNDAVHDESLKWPGYTALHFAVEYSLIPAMKILLENGAKISLKNGNGLTPFDLAIMGLNEDISSEEATREKFGIIETLLVEGDKFNSQFDRRGFSLLHVLAITREDFDDAYFLSCLENLPEGINQAINFPRSEYHGCTALHFAMRVYNYEIGKWLIKRGADIYLKDNRGLSPFQYEINSKGQYGIIEKNPDILCVPGNPFAECGHSYFHIGCILENRRIMEYYVESGVDINVRTKIGLDGCCSAKTPLHAIVHQAGDNAAECIKFLIDHGADVMARDAYLNIPPHYEKCLMNEKTVELLVTYGSDVNAQDVYGNTPLYLACQHSASSEVIAFLLNHGADINIENDGGYTPLSYACKVMTQYADVSEDKIILTLLRHTKKLILLGLYVSEENQKLYSEYFEDYTTPSCDENKFEDGCLREIRMMRDCKVNQYTTVYYVIAKSQNDMAYLSQNSSFREYIDSDDFASKFPMYGYLIKLQYKRGLIRKPLLDKCKLAFNSLAKLSSESVEKILEYLDNDDLKNIIESERITHDI